MRVTAIGTGTAWPDPERGPTAFLAEDRVRIAVDLGSGTLQRLAAKGATVNNLDAVLLTHAHLDHTADLFALRFAMILPWARRDTPLRIIGSAQTFEQLRSASDAFAHWFTRADAAFRFEPMRVGEFTQIGPIRVDTFAVVHHPSSLGYRLSNQRAAVVLPGDTGPCDTLRDACSDADLVAIECGNTDDDASANHMHPAALGALVRATAPRALAVVHRYPDALSDANTRALRQAVGPALLLPRDGDVLFDADGGSPCRKNES